ncbi:hypothetical protein [Hymenobacter actinosclerus]|uniref:hypothetical protein n=1 Tax=Hymenobacter actinosclerus TaxID=82805 RepID=UPI000B89BAD0|nr:hypothetical protein [Hymenobacter actinosclerus]
MTISIETIVRELHKVPVGRLEEAYQIIHEMAASRPAQNEDIIRQSRALIAEFSAWPEEERAAFDADLKQTRQELFNRPEPEL